MSRQNNLPFESFTFEDWKEFIMYNENGHQSNFHQMIGKLITMVFRNFEQIKRLEKRIKELESE